MKFESVRARAFGPFVDQVLHLAPGMNVVHGPNEAGKSTWHAALFAALCGMRRRRGQLRREDREFADQHRPWDGASWEVSTIVRLEDGRRVELHQDLDGRVDCRALDVVLGRDVSSEIIFEGSPDGSRWLGLDRRSFLATACVRQADLLGLLDEPALLREHLQRAATTAGTHGTAARALAAIDEFRAAQVGRDLRHSSRPLPAAKRRVERAQESLEAARREHDEFLRLSAEADQRREAAYASDRRLRLLVAAKAQRDSRMLEERFRRATELAARFPDGPPPPLAADDELARSVAGALRAWEGRPDVSQLSGPTSEELRARLQRLPAPPHGDVDPSPDVVAAANNWRDARRTLELHHRERPAKRAAVETGGLSNDELRDLARDLEVEAPVADPALSARREALLGELEVRRRRVRPKTAPVLVGATAAAGGLALLANSLTVAAIPLLALGVAMLVLAFVSPRKETRIQTLEELREVEGAIGRSLHAAQEIRERTERASQRLHSAGLPVDPEVLRRLAGRVVDEVQRQEQFHRWSTADSELRVQLEQRESHLRDLLRSKGVSLGSDVGAALDNYLQGCEERGNVARLAAQQPDLESELQAREALEETARQAELRYNEIRDSLHDVATRCDVSGETPEEQAQLLQRWQEVRSAALEQHEKARAEWAELQGLLDDRTLEGFAAEAERLTARSTELATALAHSEIDEQPLEDDPDAQISRVRAESQERQAAADSLEGQVKERARRLLSVAEAEEDLSQAEAELSDVRGLDEVLSLTRNFLAQAQDRVYRTVAPVLKSTVERWLPEVTTNRYAEVTVDPESLEVQVRPTGGRWRPASLTSLGTAEQIYLLLRVALAEHLTRTPEKCPLILDDPTAQWDSERTEAVLRVLHTVSRERQVIVFSQELDVLSWAIANLHESQDLLLRLERLPVG